MRHIPVILVVLILCSFIETRQTGKYMFIVLKSIYACEGKCYNYELTEHPKTSAEECKKQEEVSKARYGDSATYYTIAPGEGAIYYKYNKFVANCDCKIRGVHKSTSIEKAKEEMNAKIAEEKVKKPKAYHNYEVYNWWPR